MRVLFTFMCVLALGVMGCGETTGTGGSGGSSGQGGAGGSGGSAGTGGNGGTAGNGGTGGSVGGEFPCTEQGIREAIAEGGGPHSFACDGPTEVTVAGELVIDNDVVLDGEEELSLRAKIRIPRSAVVELHGFTMSTRDVWADATGIVNEGSLVVGDSTVSGNSGGGIRNEGMLRLMNSAVSGNTGHGAGGIFNSGELTLMNSTVSDNDSVGDLSFSVGGVWNEGGTLTLNGSTVSGNIATVNGSSGGFGGIVNTGTLTMTNCTVSTNSVVGPASDDAIGGIWNGDTLTMTNCTVSGNTDGDIVFEGGTVTMRNTLVDGACVDVEPRVVSSNGYNIESPGNSCGFDQGTDQVDVAEGEMNLQPLADNGGPTETHALGSGSVAIDAIPEADCDVETDQRGEPRPGGTMCDVGAFEVQP